MLKKTSLFILLCTVALLSACGDQSATKTDNNATPTAELPADAPAVGTKIADVVKANPASADSIENIDGTVKKIMWEDLVPEDYQPEAIMEKYIDEIEAIKEGSPEELKLFAKLQAEFNSAPANEQISGTTVKIPGYISPLEENDGMVSEFLLVPYFGACIHAPPPPVNQTVLVKPQEGKSIPMRDIYEPVWVVGEINVERITTDLAQAGYKIENARLEAYIPELDDMRAN